MAEAQVEENWNNVFEGGLMAGKLERINSGSGGGPKNVPTPKANQANPGAVTMPSGGTTPNGRAVAKNSPRNPK